MNVFCSCSSKFLHFIFSYSCVQGDVTEITTTHIQIHGHENEIKFDYLVIATGTSYAFPAKVPLDRSSDVAQLFAKVRGNIWIGRGREKGEGKREKGEGRREKGERENGRRR